MSARTPSDVADLLACARDLTRSCASDLDLTRSSCASDLARGRGRTFGRLRCVVAVARQNRQAARPGGVLPGRRQAWICYPGRSQGQSWAAPLGGGVVVGVEESTSVCTRPGARAAVSMATRCRRCGGRPGLPGSGRGHRGIPPGRSRRSRSGGRRWALRLRIRWCPRRWPGGCARGGAAPRGIRPRTGGSGAAARQAPGTQPPGGRTPRSASGRVRCRRSPGG